MTQPYERTRAVLDTQDFLIELASAPNKLDVRAVRLRARTLLRHFPGRADLHLSAAWLPTIWAEPNTTIFD
ncbi:BPSL0761 family protein [Paraburkholderia sp. GAS199]|uniref:BPSL0761 family protein n=1 Tax=Paraburkholderia sp. GAS199 TaxID=3035126 RepID=UPI003D1D5699